MNAAETNRDLIKRAIIYVIMSVAVLTTTVVLLFLMLGYRFNQQTGTIQQGGLVQFISQPAGASVTVGSARLTNVTRSKITLNPGEYDVTMDLKDYKSWKKHIEVKAGAVLWLNSARFIPNDPETEKVHTVGSLSSVAMRTNGKEAALLTDASQPVVTLVRIDNDANENRTVTLPAGIAADGTTHSYSLVRWLNNNRYVLMKHQYDDKVQWIVIDTEDETRSQALPDSAEDQITDIQLDPTNDMRLYSLFSSGIIKRYDVGAAKFEDTKITDAQSMAITTGGTILYATKPDRGVVDISYASAIDDDVRILRSVTTNSPVKVAGATYFNDFYLAQTIDKATTVFKYDMLGASESNTMVTPITKMTFSNQEPITSLSVKADGRFIAAESDHFMSVYDNELERVSVTPLKRENGSTNLTWLDAYHFGYVHDGSLAQVEFDNTNEAQVVKAEAAFPSVYSTDKYLYSIVKNGSGYSLQRTKLIVD